MEPATRKRTRSQTDRIIDRLRLRDECNVELAAISLKYTARISDARKRLASSGETIEAYDHNHETGECFYRLVPLPKAVAVQPSLFEARP